MKKFYILLVVLVLIPAICSAQAKIYTKKVKLSDFPTKTTKVVLTGSDLLDTPLKNEIARRWHISPYEFCTIDEYNSIKSSSDYYFLRMVDVNGITEFSLSREGLDVIGLPFCPSNNSSGREMVFMPAFIDILQTYVMDSINSDMTGYIGLKDYSKNILKSQGKEIYISRDDLATTFDDRWYDKGINLADEDDADDIFSEEAEGAIVSYTVAPSASARKGRYYVFLIGTGTHTLYYYGSGSVSAGKKSGFTAADMKIISSLKKK